MLGYYAVLEKAEQFAGTRALVTELQIQTLHDLVVAERRTRVKPTSYRDGKNGIRDSQGGRIVYLPPEAHDVPSLVEALMKWLAASEEEGLPCPMRAAIAHYQFATIHPHYDGNGRCTALNDAGPSSRRLRSEGVVFAGG